MSTTTNDQGGRVIPPSVERIDAILNEQSGSWGTVWHAILSECRVAPAPATAEKVPTPATEHFAPLRWMYQGDGAWSAASCIGDDGEPFRFRVEVGDDGTFDVLRSAGELLSGEPEPFPSFAAAVAWCQERNDSLASLDAPAPSPAPRDASPPPAPPALQALYDAAHKFVKYAGAFEPRHLQRLRQVLEVEQAKCRNQDNRDYWMYLLRDFDALVEAVKETAMANAPQPENPNG